MVLAAAAVLWVGYGVLFYGVDQIRGGNNGFLDLMIPGKYRNIAPDEGAEKKGTGGGFVAGGSGVESLAGAGPANKAIASGAAQKGILDITAPGRAVLGWLGL